MNGAEEQLLLKKKSSKIKEIKDAAAEKFNSLGAK